jgi:hypothetical protein
MLDNDFAKTRSYARQNVSRGREGFETKVIKVLFWVS